MAKPARVHIIRLSGTIMPGKKGNIISDELVGGMLEKAFRKGRRAADLVVLDLNSPGGSPAQSELIGRNIRRLSHDNAIPVVAAVADYGASGGYWIAVAADEVFALETSLVGSIGVISSSFGFSALISKLGVERRQMTVGDFKGGLDPFMPLDAVREEETKRLMTSLADSFYAWVRERRAGKLKLPEDEVFTGRLWTGREALGIGLIDGVADISTILKRRFPEGYTVRRFAPKKRNGLFSRLFGRAGTALVEAVICRLHESSDGWHFH